MKQRKRQLGVCSACGDLASPGKVTCKHCSERRVELRRRERKVNRRLGLCECGRKPRSGKATCGVCSQRRVETTRKRASNCDSDLYEALLKEQRGRCAICSGWTKRALSADHNHRTGLVRGLLCHRCNPMLGFAKDDPTILRKGAEYLERFKR